MTNDAENLRTFLTPEEREASAHTLRILLAAERRATDEFRRIVAKEKARDSVPGLHFPQSANNQKLLERIDNDTKRHVPTVGAVSIFRTLRQLQRNLMFSMAENCPQGRELSLALTKCEEAVFWANAAVARTCPEEQEQDFTAEGTGFSTPEVKTESD